MVRDPRPLGGRPGPSRARVDRPAGRQPLGRSRNWPRRRPRRPPARCVTDRRQRAGDTAPRAGPVRRPQAARLPLSPAGCSSLPVDLARSPRPDAAIEHPAARDPRPRRGHPVAADRRASVRASRRPRGLTPATKMDAYLQGRRASRSPALRGRRRGHRQRLAAGRGRGLRRGRRPLPADPAAGAAARRVCRRRDARRRVAWRPVAARASLTLGIIIGSSCRCCWPAGTKSRWRSSRRRSSRSCVHPDRGHPPKR